MRFPKTLVTALLLLSLVVVGGFGLVLMTDHHHELGCPFMLGEEAVCGMDILDHISAWQQMFSVAIPALFVLAYSVIIVTACLWKFFDPPDFKLSVPSSIRVPIFRIFNPCQELFSCGVLNPRAP